MDVEVFPRKPEEIHDLPSDPVVAAWSQRSQVQILPPLQSKTAGQSRVRGSPRARLCWFMSAERLPTSPRATRRVSRGAKDREARRRSAEGEIGDLWGDDPEAALVEAVQINCVW